MVTTEVAASEGPVSSCKVADWTVEGQVAVNCRFSVASLFSRIKLSWVGEFSTVYALVLREPALMFVRRKGPCPASAESRTP